MKSNNINILALLGASGSGKTYIKNILLPLSGLVKQTCDNFDIQFSSRLNDTIYFHAPIQVTTRSMRDGESPDSYIFFNDNSKMYEDLFLSNKLTAEINFNNHRYGTLVKDFVVGNSIWNIIIVSTDGLESLELSIHDNVFGHEVNLMTGLVLSDTNDDILKEHDRSQDFYKNELLSLISRPYDFYIPNYTDERINAKQLLNILNLRMVEY